MTWQEIAPFAAMGGFLLLWLFLLSRSGAGG